MKEKYLITIGSSYRGMVLVAESNCKYKYLWSDCIKYLSELKEDFDKILIFKNYEEAFSFIEREKANFADSDSCVVRIIKNPNLT